MKLLSIIENISKKKKYINLLKSQSEKLTKIKNKQSKCLSLTNNLNLKENQIVKYIIDITFSKTNTLLHIMSFSGKLIYFYSAGQFKFKGKNKRSLRLIIKEFYKLLVTRLKFLKGQPVVLNLKNLDSSQVWIVKLFKKKFFITAVNTFKNIPYNGCRKKKVRRKKFRTKSKKKKKWLSGLRRQTVNLLS